MNLLEVLQEIKNKGYENDIIKVLLVDRLLYIEALEQKTYNLNACINVIKKLNQNKNEAIAALCDDAGEITKGQRFIKRW